MEEKPVRIELESAEAEVLHVASRIFSAYIAKNQVNADNEAELLQKAVDLALELTRQVDVRVSAGDEVKADLENDPNYRPLG